MSKSREPNEVVDTFWSGATSKTFESDGQIRLLLDEMSPDSRTEESNKRWAIRASIERQNCVPQNSFKGKYDEIFSKRMLPQPSNRNDEKISLITTS